MKILANDGISQLGIQKLEKNGFTVVTEKVNQENLIETINQENYVALLVRSATKVRKDIIDACPQLKLIGRGGVGMDNIDVDYARSKGLKVINTPGSSSQSVAELVMSHLFSLSRSVYDSNREMPSKGAGEFNTLKKKYAKGIELRGKTIGIIGFGRIGKSLASYALGCGMKVIVTDKFDIDTTVSLTIEGAGEIKVNVLKVSFDELISSSDFISLHVPKQEDGSAVITSKEFTKMKKGVILVNAARGGVIDELDLIEALNSGTVAFAGLDVYDNEPTPREEILTHNKISLTPHIGAATEEAQDRIGEELADQIIAYLG